MARGSKNEGCKIEGCWKEERLWSEGVRDGGGGWESCISHDTADAATAPKKRTKEKKGREARIPKAKAKIPLDRPAFLITLWLLLVWRRESYPIRHTTHNIKHQPKNPCTPIGEPSSPLPPRCLSPRAPSLNHPGREPLFFFSLTCKPPWYQQPTPGVWPSFLLVDLSLPVPTIFCVCAGLWEPPAAAEMSCGFCSC